MSEKKIIDSRSAKDILIFRIVAPNLPTIALLIVVLFIVAYVIKS